MSKAGRLFNASAVIDDISSRVEVAEDQRTSAIIQSKRIREDKSIEGRNCFENSYFQTVLADIKEARGELRKKLSATKPESIGRFQVLDELLEKFEDDRRKFFN